jgi:hypothetical protein
MTTGINPKFGFFLEAAATRYIGIPELPWSLTRLLTLRGLRPKKLGFSKHIGTRMRGFYPRN